MTPSIDRPLETLSDPRNPGCVQMIAIDIIDWAGRPTTSP
jgi:hypothetical protein